MDTFIFTLEVIGLLLETTGSQELEVVRPPEEEMQAWRGSMAPFGGCGSSWFQYGWVDYVWFLT
jgi:hypothetical protein